MPTAAKTDADPKPAAAEHTSTDRLHALMQKIRAGLNKEASVDPSDKPLACKACYTRGWMAALKSLLEA